MSTDDRLSNLLGALLLVAHAGRTTRRTRPAGRRPRAQAQRRRLRAVHRQLGDVAARVALRDLWAQRGSASNTSISGHGSHRDMAHLGLPRRHPMIDGDRAAVVGEPPTWHREGIESRATACSPSRTPRRAGRNQASPPNSSAWPAPADSTPRPTTSPRRGRRSDRPQRARTRRLTSTRSPAVRRGSVEATLHQYGIRRQTRCCVSEASPRGAEASGTSLAVPGQWSE